MSLAQSPVSVSVGLLALAQYMKRAVSIATLVPGLGMRVHQTASPHYMSARVLALHLNQDVFGILPYFSNAALQDDVQLVDLNVSSGTLKGLSHLLFFYVFCFL